MGINGFFPFTKQKSPGAFVALPDTSALRGARLGVDAPILLFRARAARTGPGEHLLYVAKLLYWLREQECTSVFVFDGPGDKPHKEEERQRRGQRRAAQRLTKEKLEKSLASTDLDWDQILTQRGQIERCARASVEVTDEDRCFMKRLLEVHGWPYCTAPGEAENFLASLQLQGHIDYVVTEDSDALICGAPCIIRNFWNLASAPDYEERTRASPSASPHCVYLSVVLADLQLSLQTLRLAAVLAGCDFAPKLAGVGLARAVKTVRACASLKGCLQILKKDESALDETVVLQFERAVALLSAQRIEGAIPLCAEPSPRGRAQMIEELIKAAEATGEAGQLRDFYGHVYGPQAGPFDPPLVPSAWKC